MTLGLWGLRAMACTGRLEMGSSSLRATDNYSKLMIMSIFKSCAGGGCGDASLHGGGGACGVRGA